MKVLYKNALLYAFFLLQCYPTFAQYSMEGYHTGQEREYVTQEGRKVQRDGFTEIYFVGTGDIQFGFNDQTTTKTIAANTGLGVLFWRIWQSGHELQLDAKINIASTVDTISAHQSKDALGNMVISNTRQFGRYALIPASSGQATQINALYYFHRPPQNTLNGRQRDLLEIEGQLVRNEQATLQLKSGAPQRMRDSLRLEKELWKNQKDLVQEEVSSDHCPCRFLFFKTSRKYKLKFIDGLAFNGAASNQVWAATDQNSGGAWSTARSVNVSTLAWRAGIFHDFMPQDLGRQKGYSIRLGLNAIGRSLQGDLGLHTDPMQRMRSDFLGGPRTGYWGGELLLSLRLKNLRAEAALPYLFARDNQPIPGLTGAQFITSISFVGGFPLSLGKATN